MKRYNPVPNITFVNFSQIVGHGFTELRKGQALYILSIVSHQALIFEMYVIPIKPYY